MPGIDTRQLRKIDPWIVGCTVVLLLIGLAAVYSATKSGGPAQANNFVKQIAWVFVGVAAASVVVLLPMICFPGYSHSI